MKVKANKNFENMIDKTVGRKRKEGEIFEVDEARANLLLKHNLVEFIKVDKSKAEIEAEMEPVIKEKPIRKGKKK